MINSTTNLTNQTPTTYTVDGIVWTVLGRQRIRKGKACTPWTLRSEFTPLGYFMIKRIPNNGGWMGGAPHAGEGLQVIGFASANEAAKEIARWVRAAK